MVILQNNMIFVSKTGKTDSVGYVLPVQSDGGLTQNRFFLKNSVELKFNQLFNKVKMQTGRALIFF